MCDSWGNQHWSFLSACLFSGGDESFRGNTPRPNFGFWRPRSLDFLTEVPRFLAMSLIFFSLAYREGRDSRKHKLAIVWLVHLAWLWSLFFTIFWGLGRFTRDQSMNCSVISASICWIIFLVSWPRIPNEPGKGRYNRPMQRSCIIERLLKLARRCEKVYYRKNTSPIKGFYSKKKSYLPTCAPQPGRSRWATRAWVFSKYVLRCY
jgi:hypothetical protein